MDTEKRIMKTHPERRKRLLLRNGIQKSVMKTGHERNRLVVRNGHREWDYEHWT
jgi:hypothetical protein